VWCFVGTEEDFIDQNSIKPLYQKKNRNLLPNKGYCSGLPDSVATLLFIIAIIHCLFSVLMWLTGEQEGLGFVVHDLAWKKFPVKQK